MVNILKGKTVVRFLIVAGMAMTLLLIGCDEGEGNPTDNDVDTTHNNGNGVNGDAIVAIDHVDGLVGGKIPTGGSVSFYVRLTNSTGASVKGITNGFRVFSTDGAQWTTVTADTTGTIGKAEFDLVWTWGYYGVTGSGADTVWLAGAVMMQDGMPTGFDDVTHKITIGPVPAAATGRQICLDSAYFPPSGTWQWAPGGIPTWSGLECYRVQ